MTKEKIEIDLDKILWNEKIDTLIYYECKLENMIKTNQITEKEGGKIKKIIKMLWLRIWDSHPHQNPSIEKNFKSLFG